MTQTGSQNKRPLLLSSCRVGRGSLSGDGVPDDLEDTTYLMSASFTPVLTAPSTKSHGMRILAANTGKRSRRLDRIAITERISKQNGALQVRTFRDGQCLARKKVAMEPP